MQHYLPCKPTALAPLGCPAGEDLAGDAKLSAGISGGDISVPPVIGQLLKALRHGHAVRAEADPRSSAAAMPFA